MIIATHFIFTGYGHWFPNDPRGSLSTEVHAPELAPLAKAHFGRRKQQPTKEQLRAFFEEAQKHLHYPLLWWDRLCRQQIADGLGEAIASNRMTCYACAILSNHIHILIRRHKLRAQDMLSVFRDAIRSTITFTGSCPKDHPVLSDNACHIFKSSPAPVRACVTYIEDNYRKHGIARAHTPFVETYDGWPHRSTS